MPLTTTRALKKTKETKALKKTKPVKKRTILRARYNI